MLKTIIKILVNLEEKKKRKYQVLAASTALEIQEKAKNMIAIYGDQYQSILWHVAFMIYRKDKLDALQIFEIHKDCKLPYPKPEPLMFYAMVRNELQKLKC